MSGNEAVFNPPPGWPEPPDGWTPPPGWSPDPSWPDPPDGWELWIKPSADYGVVAAESPAEATNPTPAAAADSPAELLAEIADLRARLDDASAHVVLSDDQILQSVGIYRYHHPLEHAAQYKERLDAIGDQVTQMVKEGRAIERSEMFTFDNSLSKGRKMTDDLSKLMLRAYNAEVDISMRSLRAGNVVTAKKRVESSRANIAKLGRMMEMRISDEFHALRIEEVELTADFLMKKQQEREAEREERARLREESRVQKELADQRAELDKEEKHIRKALEALAESGSSDPELEKRLEEIAGSIAENEFRAANIRAGYVYVISNRGAFGDGVVKIGLTRRLDPSDRISELSGASVPFRFDTHALFFTEDAVGLEAELHEHFTDRRLNNANHRKEFFFASPNEVREVLQEKVGNLLEFSEHADATEYLQSVALWPERARQGPSTD